MYTQTNSGGTM